MGRQISEAFHSEELGSSNKKTEYGMNHLTRLEANSSQREKELLSESEALKEANWRSNINNFIQVVRDVQGRFVQVPNDSSFCRNKKRRARTPTRADSEHTFLLPQTKRKKVKGETMESSTSIWRRREVLTELIEISPIKVVEETVILKPSRQNASSDAQGDILDDGRVREYEEKMVTGLSPQLKKVTVKTCQRRRGDRTKNTANRNN